MFGQSFRAGGVLSRVASSTHARSDRKSLARRPLFEALEPRQMLANYTWNDAANTLQISLGDNESLGIHEVSGQRSFTLSSGTFNQVGGDAAAGSGTDAISIAASDLAGSLTIDNSTVTTGTNEVQFIGASSLTSGAIAVNIANPNAVGAMLLWGLNLTATGAGGITLEASRDVTFLDAALTTASGDITLRANQQLTPSTGQFVGIGLYRTTIATTGSGDILLEGRGGDAGFPDYGVNIYANSKIRSTSKSASAGTITIAGTGGLTASGCTGVMIAGLVSSVAGDITITGQGGGDGTGSSNHGVDILAGSPFNIISTGVGVHAAKISITGTGGLGTDVNEGLRFISGTVRSTDGDIEITGHAGGGAGSSPILDLGPKSVAATGDATITINGVVSPPVTYGPDDVIVISAAAGAPPRVKVLDAQTGAVLGSFLAYSSTFRGGVRAAVADLDGDGRAEVIVAPGAGMASLVKVFDLSGHEQTAYRTTAYAGFHGGVFIAAGDVNGDGRPDLITSPGSGRSAQIKVFKNRVGIATNPDPFSDKPIYDFQAFSGSFKGGATVAAGDLTGDGRVDIVVGNGPGMRPQVRVYDLSRVDPPPGGGIQPSPLMLDITPFRSFDRGGVFVAVGNVRGDPTPEIIIGNGANGRGQVAIYNADGTRLKSFDAYASNEHPNAPVHVATKNVDLDSLDEILTTQSLPGRARDIRTFQSDGTLTDKIVEGEHDFRPGFFVA